MSSFGTGRRTFLRRGILAAAGVLAGQGSAAIIPVGTEDFSFAVVTDFHYRDARCGEWAHKFVAHLKGLRPRPKFVCLAGDLTESGTPEQCGAVREIFTTLPMPVRAVIGNHDFTDHEERTPFEREFGRQACYRFDVGDWQFLALDSTQGRSVYKTRIPADTLQWMQRELPHVSRSRPLVVLTHFPLGRNYLRPWNAYQVLGMLDAYELRAAYSGHWHGLTRRMEHDAPLFTGRCASWWRTNHDGSKLRGYMLCRVRDGAITSEFVAVS